MEIKRQKNGNMKFFLVSVAVLIGLTAIFYLIFNIDGLSNIFAPIVYGVVLAFLMNPVLKFYENKIFAWKKSTNVRKKLCLVCSLTMTIITFFAIIALVCLLIVPQFVDSISNLVSNYEVYLQNFVDFVNDTANNVRDFFIRGEKTEYKEILQYADIQEHMSKVFSSSSDGSVELDGVYEAISNAAPFLKNVGYSIYNFLKNSIIGLFIAFYILLTKDLRKAQMKKFRKAFFTPSQEEYVMKVTRIANKNFNGFIRGKLIDSLIIGLLSYVIFEVFGVSEYNMLNAAIVGITNIVPVFGPIIGAIPVAFIVLISNPSKFLLVLILILIIQQIDGNIIGPKILGDSTSVSSLTVIIAIAVMGSILGIFGMIIGVPLFATVIAVVKDIMEKKLREKGEPTETDAYVSVRSLSDTNKLIHKEETTWLYRYEHSDVKVRIDSFLAHFDKKKGKSGKKNKSKTSENSSNEQINNDTHGDTDAN